MVRSRASACVSQLERLWPETIQRLRNKINPLITKHHDVVQREQSRMRHQFELLAVRARIHKELSRQLALQQRRKQRAPTGPMPGFKSRLARQQAIRRATTAQPVLKRRQASTPPPVRRPAAPPLRPSTAPAAVESSSTNSPSYRRSSSSSRLAVREQPVNTARKSVAVLPAAATA